MSASLALLNRIKSLETQKKRNYQLSSTAFKAAATATNSAAISSGQIYGNNVNYGQTSFRNTPNFTNNQAHNLNVSDQQSGESNLR